LLFASHLETAANFAEMVTKYEFGIAVFPFERER
jgi:hypothetical protein